MDRNGGFAHGRPHHSGNRVAISSASTLVAAHSFCAYHFAMPIIGDFTVMLDKDGKPETTRLRDVGRCPEIRSEAIQTRRGAGVRHRALADLPTHFKARGAGGRWSPKVTLSQSSES